MLQWGRERSLSEIAAPLSYSIFNELRTRLRAPSPKLCPRARRDVPSILNSTIFRNLSTASAPRHLLTDSPLAAFTASQKQDIPRSHPEAPSPADATESPTSAGSSPDSRTTDASRAYPSAIHTLGK